MSATAGYRVIRVIGRGGMATVYEGWDEKLERPVAIKELAEHFAEDTRLVQLFVAEARKMAAVAHPNILSIHAIDESSTTPRIIMELADGGTLRQQIRRGPTQPQQARRILVQLLRGLGEIHRHDGMIHRDIKPENILCSKDLYKIGDFGIAKGKDDRTAPFVTPRYMAPECLSAPELVGPASDLYSLGLVIYELVLGEERFERQVSATGGSGRGSSAQDAWASASEAFHLQLGTAELTALHTLDGSVPEDLSRVLAKMLCKEVKARYQTCEDVLAELRCGDPSQTAERSQEGVVTVRRQSVGKSTGPRRWLLSAGIFALLMVAAFLFVVPGRGVSVDVTSEPPGAEVFIGGQSLGVTPLLSVRLEKGASLVLRKEGYLDAEVPVSSQDRIVQATLIWQPITISSDPEGAKVLVRGEILGLTPFELVGQDATERVTLRLTGYEDETFEVTPGDGQHHLVLAWRPITVTSEPSGAQVVIAGQAEGRTPLQVVGQGEQLKLKLRLEGYEDAEHEVRPGQDKAHVRLLASSAWLEEQPYAVAFGEDLLRYLSPEEDLVLEIEGGGERGLLPVGARLRFNLRSRGWAGEVIFFSLLPDGEILCLYPNQFRRSLHINVDQNLVLPLPEDERRGFVLQTSRPLGRDRIFVFAVAGPLPPMPTGSSSNPWFTTYPQAAGAGNPAASFARWVAELRYSQPHETRLIAVEFEVIENRGVESTRGQR